MIRTLVKHRFPALCLISLVTLFFLYEIVRLEVATSFGDLLPQQHPYIKVHNEFQDRFGGANVISVAVKVKNGDIFNTETLGKIQRLTEELDRLEGVNHYQIVSLAHKKIKHVEATTWGLEVSAVMWPEIPSTPAEMAALRDRVHHEPTVYGGLVSLDEKMALISAAFIEGRLNYTSLFQDIQEIVEREADNNTDVFVTGQPMLYAWVYHYAPQMVLIFLITGLVMLTLLWLYFHTFQGVFIPILSAGVSAAWGLGFASALGYNLDPLILVVPLLITARAISHSVQSMERYHEEYVRLRDKEKAIVHAYSKLLPPAFLSIITDGMGVLLIAISTIPVMRKLAFFSSFWVLSMLFSVSLLHPIILSYLPPPRRLLEHDIAFGKGVWGVVMFWIKRVCTGPHRHWSWAVILGCVGFGLFYSTKLKVGDLQAGSSILWSDSHYNASSRNINERFMGENRLLIIVRGDQPDILKKPDVMRAMEAFQRHMEQSPDVGGTYSIVDMVKNIQVTFHEGDPKWKTVPDTWVDVGQFLYLFLAGSSPGDLDRFIDPKARLANIAVFYRDYKGDTIRNAIHRAATYIESHPVEGVQFHLAGGIIGVLAAINEEVLYSEKWSVIAIFLIVFVLCALSFRSAFAALLLIVPLVLSNLLASAFMAWKGIPLNINTLPVASLGVGVGVDYGIYLLSRIKEEYRQKGEYDPAIAEAILTTGKAILFTATTLIAGVIFWYFLSSLRFQAEMGLLVALLMAFNMFGALFLIPLMVSLFKPTFLKGSVRRNP